MRLTWPTSALIVCLAQVMVPAAPADAQATPTCLGRPATIVGSGEADTIDGTPGPDVIVGLGGPDRILGRGGNDLICGGRGNDWLEGNRGDDILLGGLDRLHRTDEGTERIGDHLRGGPGDDRLDPGRDTRPADDITRDELSWADSANRVRLDLANGVATGWGTDHFVSRGASVTTSAYDDRVLGSRYADRIFTGDGNDYVDARRGNDLVVLDPSGRAVHGLADRAWGGMGDDTLSSGRGADELRGEAGDDVIDAVRRGDDLLLGQSGDDLVVGILTGPGLVFTGGEGLGDRLTVFSPVGTVPTAAAWDMETRILKWVVDGAPVTALLGGFEDVDLSTFGTPWEVWGTVGGERLSGAGTTGTVFHARDGDDSFFGSSDDDLFDGQDGVDRSLGMGEGEDTCISVEVFDLDDCENVTP